MKDGIYTYNLEMTTPLGKRRGSLELMVEGEFMNGYLTMFTRTIPIRNGHCSGNQFSFVGDMKTLMKMIPYEAFGSVVGNRLDMTIMTDQGSYPTFGTLVSTRKL